MLIAVIVLGSGFLGKAHAIIPGTQRAALIALYIATNGDSWTNNSGWKTLPLDPDDGFAMPGTEWNWKGVTLDFENDTGTTVTKINLYNKNLIGTIPSEIEDLPNLEFLELSYNQLAGIPASLGNLSNLQTLAIRYSQMGGNIPASLGSLTSLQTLLLSGNQLTGSIPPELGTLENLQKLDLGVNQLTTIPVALKDLDNLVELKLSQNPLGGIIPPELGQLTNLEKLWLYNGELTGSIPEELGDLTNLVELKLDHNELTGPIPAALGDLGNLETLDLSANPLGGIIPPELGQLTALKTLSLRENELTGPIPAAFGDLENLEQLHLNVNNLQGSIPEELADLSELENLSLSDNQIEGGIPSALKDLGNLKKLYLRRNRLSGPIPSELENLGNLTHLYINGNKLSGNFPSGLMMTSLNTGDFSYNALYTSDEAVRTFLSDMDWDWEQKQTIAPEGVSVEPLTATSVRVSYTPIAYHLDAGGYRVFYSKSDGGPYTLSGGMTADKTVSEIDVTGLEAGTQYYFVVRTRTEPNAFNQNTVDSEDSEEASATIPICDLSTIKIDDPDPVTAGEDLSYTLTVQNSGPSDAENVVLTDNLPATLQTPRYSIDGGQNWSPWTGSLGLGTIAASGSQEVVLKGTVASSATARFENSAMAVTDTTDSNPANNSATNETRVQALADLEVTKEGYEDVLAGNWMTYTITVENMGPSDAVNVMLTDTVPSEMPTPEYSADGGQTWGDWTGTLSLGTMEPGDSEEVLLRDVVASSTLGTLSNTATVSSNTADPVDDNNSDTEKSPVNALADLAVTKEEGTDPIIAGNDLVYTLTVQNEGPSDAVNVTVTDHMPAQLENTQYSTDDGQTWDAWGGSLGLGALSDGSSAQVLVKGFVAFSTDGLISNTASVSSVTTDYADGNNSATEETTAVILGDMDGDSDVDLADAMVVCQFLCGMEPDISPGHVPYDLDGDGQIGAGELHFILQFVGGFSK
jgi:uncharacterized repeat protein (TIGR01451 family)